MKPETWAGSPIHDMIRDAGLDESEGAAKRPMDAAECHPAFPDTPETDAFCNSLQRMGNCERWQKTASFAADLERERNTARLEAESWRRVAAETERYRKAFCAARAFIRCHAADPDLTPEMIEKYAEYAEASKGL